MPPTYPSTGYGYIKSFDQLDQNYYKASKVDKFIEKPDLKNAKGIYQDKKYSWNSGMFVFKAKTILNELQTFTPDMINSCKVCLHESKNDLDFLRLDKKHFIKCIFDDDIHKINVAPRHNTFLRHTHSLSFLIFFLVFSSFHFFYSIFHNRSVAS